MLRRVLVVASFAWLAVMVGVFVWLAWEGRVAERQGPELVAAVEETLRSAVDEDPGVREAMLVSFNMSTVGMGDVMTVVPPVDGAEVFRFRVDDGAAVIGYRGTSLAEGVCVYAVVDPDNTVHATRDVCSVR